MKGRVRYYITATDENPVEDFIASLSDVQKRKIARVFSYIEMYSLLSVIPHVKKLTGTSLWEIRILGQDNIRILYVTIERNEILALHGFIKKTQKTPTKELMIALKRLQDWRNAEID